MYYKLLAGSIFCASLLNAQTNFIQNGDLEAGSLVTNSGQINHATGWGASCSDNGSPDLFDGNITATTTPACSYRIPTNKWANNIPVRATGHRYAGFSQGEPIYGTLSALNANCSNYTLSFWVKTIDGYADWVWNGQFQYPDCHPNANTVSKTSKVEVRLINSSNCNPSLIYTSPVIYASNNWQQLTANITLSAAQLTGNYNKIEFRIVNYAANSTGQILFMDDFSLINTPDPDLTPSITGNSSFCSGTPLTFTGNDGPGTATSTYWEIAECDANGNVTGGYVWNNNWVWYPGAPGNFTFPVNPPCNKYYQIKMAVANACTQWASTTKVIYLKCTPTVDLGPDLFICNGDCITLFSETTGAISYSWSGGGISGNTSQITVCPTVPTTYTLTVSSGKNGCTASDAVTVTPLNNDPGFSVSNNTNVSTSYFTVKATPNDLGAFYNPGFAYAWIVEDLTTGGAMIFKIDNPSCWWTFNPPNGVVDNKFDGFDHTATNYSGVVTSLPTCGVPAEGKFLFNHNYRITRGTWNSYCGWKQVSQVQAPTRNNVITFVEDNTAPDFSYLMNKTTDVNELKNQLPFTIFPNPSTGSFTIELNNAMPATVEIYNLLGSRIKQIVIPENTNQYKLDLSGYSKGIYMLNILSENTKFSQKIVLE